MNNSKTVQGTKTKSSSGFAKGIIVALGLAALTVVEYFLALVTHSPTLLMLVALLKAVIVIWFFMHVYRLWRTEGSH